MKVVMKPEVRTPGGETIGLFHDNQWIGDLYLIYREGDVLTGTAQIDTRRVNEHEVDSVFDEIREYVGHLSAAMNIEDSSVVCIYGDIEKVLEMEAMDVMEEHDTQYEPPLHPEVSLEHEAPALPRMESGQVYATPVSDQTGYHLSVSNRRNNHTDYTLHDDFDNQIGHVAVDQIGSSVSGRVEFWVEPDKGETNEVARLLTKEFAGDEVNTISFTMNWHDQHLGDIHLESNTWAEF